MKKIILIILTVLLLVSCKTKPQIVEDIIVEVEKDIEVEEPVFEILSIAIIQADLINTQFETILKIENPNAFPVELSAIRYELFGNGLLWADGIENNLLKVPAKDSLETKFIFSMNFINMNRRLLDDVIAMRRVQYNFKGDAYVRALASRVKTFTMKYNISGYSEVKPKSN
ncbi:MAG: LEA type 2 family protein [Treponema sp.]|nr:LEA type 2 family protein [Treponema sp.]MCL2271864.1 LEA type 2 family protein [Treponema sp.]